MGHQTVVVSTLSERRNYRTDYQCTRPILGRLPVRAGALGIVVSIAAFHDKSSVFPGLGGLKVNSKPALGQRLMFAI